MFVRLPQSFNVNFKASEMLVCSIQTYVLQKFRSFLTYTTSTSGEDGRTGTRFNHLPETSIKTSEMCDNFIEYTGRQTVRDNNCCER